MATTRKTNPNGARFYTVEGVEMPSVTTILQVIAKPALVKWAENTAKAATINAAADLYIDLGKMANNAPQMTRAAYVASLESRLGKQRATERESAKATEIGSQAHALVEWDVRKRLGQIVGPRPAATQAAEWAFMAFEDWANSVNFTPIFTEFTVHSMTHRYAGTTDMLALVDGRRVVVDIKTSRRLYAEHSMQIAAYARALEEMGHGPIDGGLLLRLPKVESDPGFEPHDVSDIDALFSAFISVRQVWQWWHEADEASRAAWLAKKKSGEV